MIGAGRRSKLPPVFLAGALVGAAIGAVAITNHGKGSPSLAGAVGASGAATPGPAAASSTGAPAPGGSPDNVGSTAAGVSGSGPGALPGGTSGPGPGGSQNAGGDAARPAPAPGGPAPGGPASPGRTPVSNGGATFRGVTADTITIGFLNLNANDLGAVCPRCRQGDLVNGGGDNAVIAAWNRDGLNNLYGRHIKVVNMQYQLLNSEQERSDCEQMAQTYHPFLVGLVAGGGALDQCLAQQNHLLVLDGYSSGDQDYLTQNAPYIWQLLPTQNTVWLNYPVFLNSEGLLRGQTVCMYSPDDTVTAGEQEDLNTSLRYGLHRLGYQLKVDITYGNAPNDSLAVERFQMAGCTVALVIGNLTEPSGFQNIAEQQGFHPRYPVAEASGIETGDALSDVTYNSKAEDGNKAMETTFFDWSNRSPPVPASRFRQSTAAINYCINAYQSYEHRNLDTYDNDNELRNLMSYCDMLSVVRQVILNAGPNLTQASFVAGMEKVKNLATAYISAVSFGASKQAGDDTFSEATFRSSRWQPENVVWGQTGPWARFPLLYTSAGPVAYGPGGG